MKSRPPRRIVVYVATSADGFIARPDGDVGWLDRPRPPGNYGMDAFYKSVDAVLMGRKTYELARKLGQGAYPGKKNYVFSRTLPPDRDSKVEVVSGDVGRFARRLAGMDRAAVSVVRAEILSPVATGPPPPGPGPAASGAARR